MPREKIPLGYELPPALSFEEAQWLAQHWVNDGDIAARDQFIVGTMAYALGIAYEVRERYRDVRCNVSPRDLAHEAFCELVAAVNAMTNATAPFAYLGRRIGKAVQRLWVKEKGQSHTLFSALDAPCDPRKQEPCEWVARLPDIHPDDKQVAEVVEAITADSLDHQLLEMSRDGATLDEMVLATGRPRSSIGNRLQQLRKEAKKVISRSRKATAQIEQPFFCKKAFC